MRNHRHRSFTVVFGLLLALQAHAAPVASRAADQAAVVATMEAMYVAATNDDLSKFHAVAARKFYAYDNGKRFDGDALMELIKSLHAAGKIFVWRVTQAEVQVHGDMAWITYVNEGSVQDASSKKDMAWLESAVLKKYKSKWRIEFFHSTRVP